MPDIELPDDLELSRLRKQLDAVGSAIVEHHGIRFRKRTRGYEIAIDNDYPMIDEIKRDAIIAEIEQIMSGEQP